MIDSYHQAIDYLYRLQWYGAKLGLENIELILSHLSHPDRNYPTVHIAGTNGKGSTAAILASVLQAHGYRVGLYTSPHLVDFPERIRINGEPISSSDVVPLTERIAQAVDQVRSNGSPISPTFFEFTTAMALLYFSDCCVDIAVIEVGMGGRFDATNVIQPILSVITNIDFDHQEQLGGSLDKIASEKAGIIKRGIPTVTAVEHADALAVIESRCREQKSELLQLGSDFDVDGLSNQDFSYQGRSHHWQGLFLTLQGRHQLQNAGCALASIEVLNRRGIRLDEGWIREGLRSVRWEGRLERIETAEGRLILLDGAHNGAGAKALRDYLNEYQRLRSGRLILVIGILKDKDIAAILGMLAPIANLVILTRPDYHRAAPISHLESIARQIGLSCQTENRVTGAVEVAIASATREDTICITGSLFTVGEARALLKNQGIPSPLKG